MTVVLIGEAEYEEFDMLAAAIEQRGGETITWDTRDWPSSVPVTYDVGSDAITVADELHVGDVTGVFAWTHHIFEMMLTRFADRFETDGTRNLFFKLDQWRGVFSSLLALFEHHGATVFTPPWEQHYHETKPLQLAQFADAGIAVPETVFTTDPDRVREFVAAHGEVVYKPVGAHTMPRRLTEAELSEAPLGQLSNAPVQFQAYVPGDDLRAYFLDGDVIGASRYVTDDWTYKTEGAIEDAEPVALREEVRRDVERAATLAPMRFGAADLRVTPDDHAILEVNPNPRFAFHDLNEATDVAGALATRLVD